MVRRMFIHELDGWPGMTWDAGALSGLLGQVRHQQGVLLGRMGSLGFDLRDEAHLHALTRDAVESSAIEGELLNAGEVRSSIARRLGVPLGGLPLQSSQKVEGIVEVLLDATQNASSPLTRQRLWGWHAALFPAGYSGMRRITVGAWRRAEDGPMQVVSGPVGRERLHFEAPAAERLQAETDRFLSWFESATTSSDVNDPVISAAVAHLWFVTIHPFEDGNGRIGRAIADMALTRADGVPRRFYSLSAQLMAERKDYYRELEAAQGGGLDITDWLRWFLGCLGRAISRADEIVGAVLRRARVWARADAFPPANDRQRVVLERLLGDFEGHLTTSKYATLAKCSADTALRDIEGLLERGLLVRNPGAGRSTSYRLADQSEA